MIYTIHALKAYLNYTTSCRRLRETEDSEEEAKVSSLFPKRIQTDIDLSAANGFVLPFASKCHLRAQCNPNDLT